MESWKVESRELERGKAVIIYIDLFKDEGYTINTIHKKLKVELYEKLKDDYTI